MITVCENVLKADDSSAWAKALLAQRNQRCDWKKNFPESLAIFDQKFRAIHRDLDQHYDKNMHAAFVKHMVCLLLNLAS